MPVCSHEVTQEGCKQKAINQGARSLVINTCHVFKVAYLCNHVLKVI